MTPMSLAALALLISAPPTRPSDDLPIGTTVTLPVITVSVVASGGERVAKRGVYAPPPGWYVRSHRVVVSQRTGSVSYSVSTVPAGWAWRAEEQTTAAGRSGALAMLSAYHVLTGGGHAEVAQSAASSDHRQSSSSHHLLMLEVTAHGPGLWRGESVAELTVVAELVRLGR